MVLGTTAKVTVASTVAVALAGAGYLIYKKKKPEIIPSTWEEVGTLIKVQIYPLKSGNKVELDEAECTRYGLKQTEKDEKSYQLRDRGLVVYGESDHKFRTGRTYPEMVKIDVYVHDKDHLAIDAPEMATLFVKIPTPDKENETKILLHQNEEIYAIDCGDEAASWFSRYIVKKPTGLRLAYHDASRSRDITKTHANLLSYYIHLGNLDTGLYSDLTSVLLINQKSVDDLNNRMEKSTVSANNFRPNLVIDGSKAEAYAEHDWDWVKIGDVVFRNVKECTRCVFTTVHPENGTRDPSREPLKTLETYRMSNGPAKLPVMGINLGIRKAGLIKRGATVYMAKNSK